MVNYKKLAQDLQEDYEALRSGALKIKQAQALANHAGKLLAAHKGKLAYNQYMEIKEPIPFFEDTTE